MATRDYYEILGVPSTASDEVIKKAYRRLARQYHPDRVQGDGKEAAEAKFKEISAAYDTLGDPEKRKTYDQMRQFGSNFGGGAPFGGQSPFGSRTGPFESTTFRRGSSPFSQGGGFATGGFDDLLSAMFGGMREAESETSIEVSLEEAAAGTSREILHPRTGKHLRVRIPPGVATGSKVRAGDLQVSVTVKPHAFFDRDHENLRMELPLTFWEAIEGAELEVPTLEGAVKMKIPPRTQAGRVFRLKGKGMPRLKGEGRGDLLVKAVIHLPPDIDENALALWKRLSSMSSYNPRSQFRRGG